ncbi:FHA domain-containing protein [Polyangium aurulentum]|uniref:FHA domain-containing protein n=1 Tax=Polyangium aurulentum TaxID=2567896 RepID=UPI0010AEAF5D|nr:FHA domain-containing protein [Polyangium aurulentum]UQA57423.1 FHA domain-containing protein [Polyangium aurulentum]
MGVIKHISSGRTIVLAGHSVVGRAPGCVVRLTDHAASNDHASLFWTGQRWEARDLGSTNGTFIDGERLPSKANEPLAHGSVLRFGCDAESWKLIDARGPVVVARSMETGEVRAAEDGLLALPDPTNVLLSIVMDSDGQWLVETPDGSRRLARDTERVTLAEQTWELTVPPASTVAGTYKAKASFSLATLTLRFHVSRDEEHVHVEAVDGDEMLSLGERTIFRALLQLARERLKDAAEARLPEDEQGWYHLIDLTRDLAVEERSLNVDIHRVREAFAKAGIEGAEGIVQRRSRQLRIGTGRLEERKA